jgi:hypothetical protein
MLERSRRAVKWPGSSIRQTSAKAHAGAALANGKRCSGFRRAQRPSLAADGAGLGAVWGRETARRMLREAGFSQIEMTQLEHDFQNYYCVARR